MTYSPNWDLATIPDAPWHSEQARRNNAKRNVHAGGRKSLCGYCDKCRNCKLRAWRLKKLEKSS